MEGPPQPAEPPLASLSLTHVHYIPGDAWSYGCAWLALVPQGLCVVYASLMWATRELELGFMFVGQMACEALNWGLKRWIKEERPKEMYGKGYGMPSSHAQFAAFFSAYLTLFLLLRHQPHQTSQPAAAAAAASPTTTITSSSSSSSSRVLSRRSRIIVSILAQVGAGAVAASRVYLRYHTPRQVLAGAAAGVVCALGWFAAMTWLRRCGVVDEVLDHGLVRALRVRDLLVDEDLVEAGWLRWEEKRASRRRVRMGNNVGGKKTR